MMGEGSRATLIDILRNCYFKTWLILDLRGGGIGFKREIEIFSRLSRKSVVEGRRRFLEKIDINRRLYL